MIYERLGGDVGIYGLDMPELMDPCVLNGVNDEGTKAVFGDLVHLEILPQQCLDGLGAEADNGSGAIWDRRVYIGLCRSCDDLVE